MGTVAVSSWSRWVRYGVAVVSIAVATTLRLLLDPAAGRPLPLRHPVPRRPRGRMVRRVRPRRGCDPARGRRLGPAPPAAPRPPRRPRLRAAGRPRPLRGGRPRHRRPRRGDAGGTPAGRGRRRRRRPPAGGTAHHAGEHRRCRPRDRRRGPGRVAEPGRRGADRVGRRRGGGRAAGGGLRHRQRADPPAGREPGRRGC